MQISPSFHYTILEEEKLFVVTVKGNLSAEDCEDMLHQLWSHPAYNLSYRILLDFNQAKLKLKMKCLSKVVKCLKTKYQTARGRISVISSGRANANALLQLSFLLMSWVEFRVFPHKDAALLYLGSSDLA